jgi:NTE family protein
MKRAIVISGGGSKGAFAVGALEHLILEKGLTFDIISGTSTGALMAPLVATGELSVLIDAYTSVSTEDIIIKRELANVLRSNSIFDTAPLEQLIRKHITAERVTKILNSGKQVIITTVCLQTGSITYFSTDPTITAAGATVVPMKTRDDMRRAVLASSNQPVFMRPVPIPSGQQPVRQFCDGGVREIAPLRVVIDNGATDVYAIILSPETRSPNNVAFNTVIPILLRTIGLFTEDVVLNDVETARLYNRAVLYLTALAARIGDRFNLNESQIRDLFEIAEQPNPFKGKHVLTLFVIRPETELSEGLEFNPDEMAAMMKLGKKRAAALVGE